jgi:tetratricopeptide (TPR) repeat protein
LRLDSALAEAAIALANVLETLLRPLEAEEQLRRLLADKPDCAPAAHNLGLLLQRRDDCDHAEECFRRAIEADPSFVAAYTALGDLVRNAGRAKDAEPWYRKALAADTTDQIIAMRAEQPSTLPQ